MGAVTPAAMTILDQKQLRFVKYCGCLQRMASAFSTHIMMCEPVQFGLCQRNYPIKRGRISAALSNQKLSDLLLRR
jgi:hypothetical protein